MALPFPDDAPETPPDESHPSAFDAPPFALPEFGLSSDPDVTGHALPPAGETPPAPDPAHQEAVDALLSEPFARRPWALVPKEGGKTREYTDYIIHKDIENEHQCVLLFDSIVDSFAVAEQYEKATGREAESVECDLDAFEDDRFWVKYYRTNGLIAFMPISEYKKLASLD